MSLTFFELQDEVEVWSRKNFPDAKPYQPLLGVSEEVGELCHAHLKMEQGIRTNENHREQKIDAVGDIIIYLADYCSRNGISMGVAVETVWNVVKERNWVDNKEHGV